MVTSPMFRGALAEGRFPSRHDLDPVYYASRIDKDKKARNHIRQLQALGFTVTLTPAA